MKKIFSFVLSIFVITLQLTTFSITASAATAEPLDEIQSYEIRIDPRTDGTLDMHYTIVWKVLDDKSEGPLEWVKIGNPNSHVDEIVGISDNIEEIYYYEESGKTYIRVNLDKKYYAGDILTIEYSIHQAYMYIVEEESHLVRYSFTAGWFPEINVKNIKVLWNENNVIEASTDNKEEGYYIWEDSLDMDERFNVSVKYNSDVFDYNLDEQYVEGSDSNNTAIIVLLIIVGIVVVGLVIFIIVVAIEDDGYHGGFGGRGGVFISHSSCASSCACVSSCACACACAGGGRAGCTKKDFYHTNLNVKDLEEVLKD